MTHVPSAILSVKEVKNELKSIRKLIKAGEKALAKLKAQEAVLAKEVEPNEASNAGSGNAG
jgi:hypothetical protein